MQEKRGCLDKISLINSYTNWLERDSITFWAPGSSEYTSWAIPLNKDIIREFLFIIDKSKFFHENNNKLFEIDDIDDEMLSLGSRNNKKRFS